MYFENIYAKTIVEASSVDVLQLHIAATLTTSLEVTSYKLDRVAI